jgi:hypothetical protein
MGLLDRFKRTSSPTKSVEKPRNIEAEKLALRLIKNRQKYKLLKKSTIVQIQQYNLKIQQLTHGLLCCIAKNNGVIILQKELMDSVSENMETMELHAKALKDTPGDVEIRILDTTKDVEEAKAKLEEAIQNEK